MLGYDPPQPRYWKALLVVAPLVAQVAWSLHLIHIKLPAPLLIGGAIISWLVLAQGVNARVTDDWRARFTMAEEADELRPQRKN